MLHEKKGGAVPTLSYLPRDAQWGLASYTRAGHLAVPSGRWAGWWDILPVFVVGWGCL